MMTFLSLVLAIGLVNLTERSDYWSTESITHIPWFSAVMPRAQFFAMLRYIHISNNDTTQPVDSPDYKFISVGTATINPSMLNNSFKTYYYQ